MVPVIDVYGDTITLRVGIGGKYVAFREGSSDELLRFLGVANVGIPMEEVRRRSAEKRPVLEADQFSCTPPELLWAARYAESLRRLIRTCCLQFTLSFYP
jgi:hypothetical protein